MKTPLLFPTVLVLASIGTGAIHAQSVVTEPVGFKYQGQLGEGGLPATGIYDVQFHLFDAAQGGAELSAVVQKNDIGVTNGLFSVDVGFTNGLLILPYTTNASRWLEIAVRHGSSNGAFTPLTTRQRLAVTPYALQALNVDAAGIQGTIGAAALGGNYANPVTFANAGNAFTGSFTGDGGAVSNVNAALFNGLPPSVFWKTIGNGGTTISNNFLGTTDNQPLELRVNNTRALRIEPTADTPNIIGNSLVNQAGPGVVGAVIGGGGSVTTYGLVYSNRVYANFSVIAGGWGNTVASNSTGSGISGGQMNLILANSGGSVIGGGQSNTIASKSSVIGGGLQNLISSNSDLSAIVGGSGNTASNGYGSTITGGRFNLIGANNSLIGSGEYNKNYGSDSIVMGGSNNLMSAVAVNSAINGGSDNTASNGYGSTITGGRFNLIGANNSLIGSGEYNKNYGSDSIVMGGSNNLMSAAAVNAAINGGSDNTISNSSGSTITGGRFNLIGAYAHYSAIGGGQSNTIASKTTVISGGLQNLISSNADFSVIGGGWGNTVASNSSGSSISGGKFNVIGANAYNSVIGGGAWNTVTASNSVVPGGASNTVSGAGSFAAGSYAVAPNNGSFVWSDDSTTSYFTSTNDYSFNARAAGGYRLYTSSSGAGGAGVYLAAGGNSWVSVSDRNAKKNFQPVNPETVLAKLASVPIQQWNYKWEKDSDVPNIGPMAQDFMAAFYPGRDDKGISTLEFDGVELAAIQGLNEKVESGKRQAESQMEELRAENAELKARLEKLEQTLLEKK